MKQNQGFALMELLITIAILGILAGIIMPVISAAKNKSQQIVCANNLRQMYLALEQYANDNNGLLPRSNNSSSSGDGTKECTAEVWFKAIDRYLINSQLPTQRDVISQEERLLKVKQDPVFIDTVASSNQDTTRTIKMNQSLISDSECQRSLENIPYQTTTVLLFDGNIYNSSGNYSNAVANKFEGSYGSVAQRHSKAANILFTDGHVERIQNGNSNGTTNAGWPNRQAGLGLIWDPDDPDLP